MNPIKLAWYQVSSREWRADTLFGQVKVISNTLPQWYKRVWTGKSVTLGYTIYFQGRRVGWTVEGWQANDVAAGVATAEVMKRTEGRLAQ